MGNGGPQCGRGRWRDRRTDRGGGAAPGRLAGHGPGAGRAVRGDRGRHHPVVQWVALPGRDRPRGHGARQRPAAAVHRRAHRGGSLAVAHRRGQRRTGNPDGQHRHCRTPRRTAPDPVRRATGRGADRWRRAHEHPRRGRAVARPKFVTGAQAKNRRCGRIWSSAPTVYTAGSARSAGPRRPARSTQGPQHGAPSPIPHRA
jgi:hypothetical protein